MALSRRFIKITLCVMLAETAVIFLKFENPINLIVDNWVVTPIAFVAAAFANASAVGGGFLFVPLFIYVYGLTPVVALKLSLATQAFGMSSGALGWSFRYIEKKALLFGGVSSLLGMWVGTYWFQIASEDIKPFFGWMSIVIFIAVMLEIKFGGSTHNVSINKFGFFPFVGYLAVTLFGGVFTSWTAIGVGEFVALYLMFVYKVRIETAIATGVAVLAVDSIAGLLFHVDLGGVRWDLLAFTIPGVVLGGFFGARVGRYVEQKLCKPKVGMEDRPKEKGNHSPLKWVFSVIILVDGASILVHSYI